MVLYAGFFPPDLRPLLTLVVVIVRGHDSDAAAQSHALPVVAPALVALGVSVDPEDRVGRVRPHRCRLRRRRRRQRADPPDRGQLVNPGQRKASPHFRVGQVHTGTEEGQRSRVVVVLVLVLVVVVVQLHGRTRFVSAAVQDDPDPDR